MFAFPGIGDELEVLAGGDGIDGLATFAVGIGVDQRPYVHDSLALLARDLRPVVGVCRVRKIFVLLELLTDRGKEVVGANAFRASGDLSLDGELLRSPDDVLDHGARREVLEVHDFGIAPL